MGTYTKGNLIVEEIKVGDIHYMDNLKIGDKVYSEDFGFIEGFISEVVGTPLHPMYSHRFTIRAKVKVNEMGVDYISERNIYTSSFHINPNVTSNRGWSDYGSLAKMFFFTSENGIEKFKVDYSSYMVSYHLNRASEYKINKL